MNYYRICGMNIAAGLELPGAVPLPGFDHAPDAIVERGFVPQRLLDATRTGPTWQLANDRMLLNVPGVARFLISGGHRVEFEPEPGRADAELSIFVMGSAMGALLHQRGSFVLHASAVAIDGRAMLFCGQSGAGKSSLVAALSNAGHPFVTDDVAVVHFDNGQPYLVPDGRRLKLWADAINRLSLGALRKSAVRPGIEKYWVDPATGAPQGRYAIAEVFFLKEVRPPDKAGIRPLHSLEAVESLRANAYRPRLVSALNQEPSWFAACGALTRHANAYSLARHLSYDKLDSCLDMLEEHWCGVPA